MSIMSTNRSRVILLVATLAASSTLLATLDNQKGFLAKYPDAKDKGLGKCTTCHVKPLPKKEDHELNAYGKDLKEKAVVDAKAEKKTYDFAKIESLDSDGDGVSNIDEIKKGTNPGDPKSK